MKFLVCDDEKLFTDIIKTSLAGVVESRGIDCSVISCDTGEEAINLYKEHKPEAVFLDISMPDMDGFSVARTISLEGGDVEIIFVSSKEELVYRSYEYKPFWFVPKSHLSLLDEVIERLFDKLEAKIELSAKITLNIEGRRKIEIDPYEIAYFKTESHYVQMVDKNGNTSKSYRNKLTNIEKQLETQNYVRIHVRYLVNCRHVRLLGDNECVFKNGEKLPVSRSRAEKAKEAFLEYMRRTR